MTNKERISEKERIGRARFENDFGKSLHIEFSGLKERYDAKATGITKGDTFVVEIKVIGRPYTKYNKDGKDKGFLIDYDKLDAIEKVAIAEGRIPWVVVYFTDFAIVWNLFKINWREREEMEEVNKEGINYGKEKERSRVTYLYEGEGKRYDYIYN